VDDAVLLCVSGRGDKDVSHVAALLELAGRA
jgi:tryptophan synthase beta subunit